MSQLFEQRDRTQHTAYRHVARPEWGMAMIAWEREGKRGYKFEDGQLRVFASGHYHLLDAIALAPERLRTLRGIVGSPEAADAGETSALPSPVELPSLDEQIDHFLRAYPGGFAGRTWQDAHRGGSGRARKRQREPAIAFARERLTAAHLGSCLERRREHDAIESLTTVLGRTDLVPFARLERLKAVSPDRARRIAAGLFELLFAREGVEVRLMQWIQALTRGTGQPATWNLATAPLALVEPARYICVTRSSFLAQAAAIAPRLRLPMAPNGYAYGAVLAMAEQIRLRLEERGCPPADRLDIHDFIASTMRADARLDMAARRHRKAS